MKISTIHRGIRLEGIVRTRSQYYLEVALTAPARGIITHEIMPYSVRNQAKYEGEWLSDRASKLLIDAYEVACLAKLTG